MKIDNLKKVQRYFERFASRLEQASKVNETMASKHKDINENDYVLKFLKEINDIARTYEFANICHKAKAEVENLDLNNKQNLLESYFDRFTFYQNKLNDWEASFTGDPYFITQIDIALAPLTNVMTVIEDCSRLKFDKIDTKVHSPIFNVSPIKSIFKKESSTFFKKNIGKNPFQLSNPNTYSNHTGELLRKAEQREYNTYFVAKVVRLKQMEFRPFFEYHYSGSQDKKAYLEYLKYAISETVRHEGLKRFILDWVQEVENNKLIVQQSPPQPHREEKTEINNPTTEINIPFEGIIFKDEYSTKLFCYLIDHYHNGKDKELSNIYQWMENNVFIHQNKRKEYKDLVKKYKITKHKYSRVHPSTEYDSTKLDPTFNELQKQFDKEIK